MDMKLKNAFNSASTDDILKIVLFLLTVSAIVVGYITFKIHLFL